MRLQELKGTRIGILWFGQITCSYILTIGPQIVGKTCGIFRRSCPLEDCLEGDLSHCNSSLLPIHSLLPSPSRSKSFHKHKPCYAFPDITYYTISNLSQMNPSSYNFLIEMYLNTVKNNQYTLSLFHLTSSETKLHH